MQIILHIWGTEIQLRIRRHPPTPSVVVVSNEADAQAVSDIFSAF